jgi:hypothetical protein
MKKVLLVTLLLLSLTFAVARGSDDEEVWAALPCATWKSMGLDGPPWCMNRVFLPIVVK